MRRQRTNRQCPRCGSKDIVLQDSYSDGVNLYICSDCDHDFEVGGSHRKNGSNRRERYAEPDEETEDYEIDG